MHYTNDETDVNIRTRNYYLYVWVMPVLVFLAAGVAVLLTSNNASNFSIYDGQVMTVGAAIAFTLHNWQKKYWLKMSDGTFYNVRNSRQHAQLPLPEPSTWEAEYSISALKRFLFLIIIVVIGIPATWMMIRNNTGTPKAWALPASLAAFIGAAVVTLVKEKGPQLKLARAGIWSLKLGFIPWAGIKKTAIEVEKDSDNSSTYLEVYLYNTPFAQAGVPDDRIEISNLTNYTEIEPLIQQLKPSPAEDETEQNTA